MTCMNNSLPTTKRDTKTGQIKHASQVLSHGKKKESRILVNKISYQLLSKPDNIRV